MMNAMGDTVSRVGEPVLKRGPSGSSLKQQNQYEIRTTPLPPGPKSANWLGCFNSRLTGGQFLAIHDGSKIVAECWPDDEPNLTAVVDAAIEYANENYPS